MSDLERPGTAKAKDALESDAFGGTLSTWRRHLVGRVLRLLAVIGALALVAGIYNAYQSQILWLISFYVGVYLLVLLSAFWKRVSYVLQAGILLAAIYVLGFLGLMEAGLSGDGRVFLLTLPVMTALLLGRRAGVWAMVLTVLTLVSFGWMFNTERLVISLEQQANTTDPSAWTSGTIVFLMLGLLTLLSQNYMLPRFAGALARSSRLTQELERRRAELEAVVAERTASLERRALQMATASQLVREAASIHDVERLMERTVHLISERFGFYHAGLFLVDETGEYAVLQAVSSEGGKRMLARGHRLKVGEEGVVGYVVAHGEPRIALDIDKGLKFLTNPDLPETRSEIALSLRMRECVIGVLDVQSTQADAFTEEDILVLQTLADQLALAISNTRLFQQTQESLEAERRAYGELSREAWRELLHTRPDLGQRYDPRGILPDGGQWREEMKLAVREGKTVLGETLPLSSTVEGKTLATPIKVRDQVIGVLDAYKPAGAGEWTTAEITLLETLTEQLGTALESARLYQETQRRATREQLVGEVTARMRETLDVETVLKTAAREIGEALGLATLDLQLGTEAELISG